MTSKAEQLEAAIENNPDDADAYLVYADWLQSQGDPRGELIVLHHQNKLVEANEHIDKHRAHFLGPLAEFMATTSSKRRGDRKLQLAWQLGFIHTADIGWETYGGKNRKEAAADLAALLDLPSARFMQGLSIGPVPADDFMSFSAFLEVLVEKRRPTTLRTLYAGDIGHWDISSTSAGPFAPVLDAFPKLRTLTIHAGDIGLRVLEHGELRELAVQTGGLGDSALEELCKAKLPKLEKLEVWFGTPNYGGITEVARIAPLLDAQRWPNVKHLGLMNAAFTDDIVRMLATSSILKQLTHLDLTMGTLSDDGVQAMVAAKSSFAHLEHLDLDDNALTDDAESLVEGLAKHVNFGDTQEPERVEGDIDDRYTSVGE